MQYQLPIFENLCPGWQKISHLGIRRVFARGASIIDLDMQVNGVYLVKEGAVEVILYTPHGPEKVLYYVGPGCIFGEVSCFVSGEIDEARVRARSACVCYFFSREQIEGMLASQYPHLLIELIRAEAHKIRMYGVLLQDSLSGDRFMRVCKMLVYLVRFRGMGITPGQKQVNLQPQMTQTDMARLMGVHRVTVTKAVGRLKQLGILEHFSKTSLAISDFPALCGLIETEE